MNIDFDTARRERQRQFEGLTFTLGGETFKCRSALPLADLWIPLPEAPERIAKGATTVLARRFLDMACQILSLLEEGETERWWELFDPGKPETIEATDLVNVWNRLSEEYTGRPPSPSDASSNGRRAETGSTSNSAPDETASET